MADVLTDQQMGSSGEALTDAQMESPKPDAMTDEQMGIVPSASPEPDMSATKNYIQKNLDAHKVYSSSQEKSGATQNKSYADNFMSAFIAGIQGSTSGLIIHGAPTTILPENASRAMRVMSQTGQMIGDAPQFLAASVAAGGPETPIGMGAGFGAVQAIRKFLMDHYEKGDIKNASDFVDRLVGSGWEYTKGMITGVATAATGGAAETITEGFAGPALTTAAKTAAELGSMTTIGSALEGHLPHFDDFLDGALVLGGIHGIVHVVPKLRNIHSETGQTPADVVTAASQDVQLKQDILAGDNSTPKEAQPTDLRITPSEKDVAPTKEGETPTKELTGEPPKVELVPKEDVGKIPPIDSAERSPEAKEILDKIGISEEPKNKEFGQKFDDWYARNQDYLDPLYSALKEAKANGAEISAKDDAYQKGRRFAAHTDTVRSFAEFGTRDGITNEINGEGLNAIFKDIPDGDINGYRAYGIAKRALELDDRKITPYSDFDREKAQKVVDEGQDKFEEINQRRVDFENRVLDFANAKGLISDDSLSAIKEANQNHIPLNRVQDPDFYTGKVRGGSAIKKIYGSDLNILDPILQTYKNTESIIKKAMINDIRNSFVDSMRDGKLLEEGGEENPDAYLTEVKKTMLPREVSSEEIVSALKKQGIEGIDPDAFNIFRPESTYLKDNQIQIMVDGKPKIYEGAPGVIDSLKRMDGDFTSIDAWSKVMRTFANMTRVGVVVNPGFALSHFFRSQIMAGVYSKTGMIPFFDSAMVLKELIGKESKDYQDWVYHGGASSSFMRLDDSYMKDNVIESSEKEAPIHGLAWNAVHTAMEATEGFIRLTDNASRFAEYKKSIAQGTSPEEAAFRSREVVPDYQKVGLQRSALRTGVAFIGAHINSLDRMAQAFQEDPKSTIAKLSALTAVSAMLYAANKDDEAIQSQPNWMKDQYWLFNVTKLIGGESGPEKPATILRLPKPWAPGILFGSGAEVALDSYFKENPNRFKDFVNTFQKSIIPEPIPNIIQPVLEQWRNKNNFTGRPLVNEGLEKELPEMQYKPYTSNAAKQIAKIIGYVPYVRDIGPEGSNVPLQSPIVIENYIHAWGGTAGGWALKTADALINQEKRNEIDKSSASQEEKNKRLEALNSDKAEPWQDSPVLHSFLVRYPSFNTQYSQDFYDAKKEADRAMETYKMAAKNGDIEAAQKIANEHPDFQLNLNEISKGMATARKTYQIIQDDPKMPAIEKRQLLDTILFQYGSIAKQGSQMISDFKKRNSGTLNQGE